MWNSKSSSKASAEKSPDTVSDCAYSGNGGRSHGTAHHCLCGHGPGRTESGVGVCCSRLRASGARVGFEDDIDRRSCCNRNKCGRNGSMEGDSSDAICIICRVNRSVSVRYRTANARDGCLCCSRIPDCGRHIRY